MQHHISRGNETTPQQQTMKQQREQNFNTTSKPTTERQKA
jgi:hypothetical protein